ncbi:MAG: DUF927 domain-containing protein [Clostridiales Family XIII bacterium]|nr:DUF927 domain-containing protein [Clostridiales Family XIII bacterium]
MGDGNEIAKYTKEDFLEGTAPYEEVYQYINDPFELERAIERMSAIAKGCKVGNFKTLFKTYCQKMKAVKNQIYAENATNFDGQEMELSTGQWIADEYGITKKGPYDTDIVACVHPIMPVERLVNIDTGIEKLRIVYKKGKAWRSVISDRKTLANSRSIVNLSDYGVAVTSESAKYLVQYISDVENLNYDVIPEHSAVSRLGWIGDNEFSPYVDDLIFDGAESFEHIFHAVQTRGSYKKWLEFVKEIRAQSNIPTKIIFAASFASVLVKPCNCLPFFVHLWNGSGNGKTVALMLAASVWANPSMGAYIHTFNSTDVAQELMAGFVNSLPLMLDELQIKNCKKEDFDKMIYKLSEGVGRMRGAKTGGLQKTSTWKNCILSTGEDPISTKSSGSGAINRIIEVNTNGITFFQDAKAVADFLMGNYGFAGRAFVEELMKPESMQLAKDTQKSIFDQLKGKDITDKQIMAASLILTADALIDAWIFKDGNGLAIEEVTQFLSTHSEVSADARAYEWLIGWLAQNGKKLCEGGDYAETWGKINKNRGTVAIIKDVFAKACHDNGYNYESFLSWMKRENLLELQKSGKGYTKSVRICGIACHCVVVKNADLYGGFEPADEEEVEDF